MKIYADHAATTQLDIEAFEAMQPYLCEEYGNTSQPYSFARAGRKALKEARMSIAECIHAEPEEIFFTSGGTESDNWAIKGSALVLGDYRETVTSQIEHHAILNACAFIERLGYPVKYLPVDNKGIVSSAVLDAYTSSQTKLVSVMYANNEIGTVEPIGELAQIAHAKGALFHTDAVQAVGHIPINVNEVNVDMLSASAHKFNGPKGIGFLYIKKGTELNAYMDGGAQEMGRRAGTENVASIVGMAIALKNSCMRMQNSTLHLKAMECLLMELLREEKLDFILNGGTERIPGNMSLSFKNMEGERLMHRLDFAGISVSTGSACDSTNTQLSHVLKAIRVHDDYAHGTVRISLGHENTEDEIRRIASVLARIIKD